MEFIVSLNPFKQQDIHGPSITLLNSTQINFEINFDSDNCEASDESRLAFLA